MKKISSYQKLKLELERSKEQKNELIRVIVEDDFLGQQQVKGLWHLKSSIEKQLFFGDIS